jgi:hypothetical protein
MDELLKACAQKRREAAGDAMNMDPATRSMLQQEVARHYSSKAVPTPSLAGGWHVWWPRWAWVGGVMAVTVTLWVMLRSTTQPGKPEFVLAKQEVPPRAEVDQLAKPEKAKAEPATLRVAESDRQEQVALQPKEDTGANKPSDVSNPLGRGVESRASRARYGIAPATAARPAPAVPNAPPSGLGAKRGTDELKTAGLGDSGGAQSGELPAGQLFQRTDLRARYRRNLNAPAVLQVLDSFRIVRNAEEIQIIDGDGSIYTGAIRSASTPQAYTFSSTLKPEPTPLLTNAPKSSAVSSNEASNLWQTFDFEAQGTNRTLNQAVVFQGNYLVSSPAQRPRAQPAVGLGGSSRQVSQSRQSTNYPAVRIRGTVRVAGTNQLPIEAVPVGQGDLP